MILRLNDEYIVNTENVKIARVAYDGMSESYSVVIEYYDEKKNPKVSLRCETEDQGKEFVDKIFNAIK